MLPIFLDFLNFQIQVFLKVLLFFLTTRGHYLIFLTDLHNYNLVGYTIAVALCFTDIQFFHWKPFIKLARYVYTTVIKQSFARLKLEKETVSILLEPWRASKSVASFSSETVLQAWAYKRAKVIRGFFSTTKH